MPDTVPALLTTFLADHDQPCPQCGYNLRNLQGARCPECGEDLVLRVNVAEPRQKLLIAGLIGLSAGAGLNGLLLIYGIIMSLRERGAGDVSFWLTCGLGLLIEAGAMIIWLRCWRPIRRLPKSTRLILAISCWALTLIDLVIFSYTVE